MSPRIVLAGAAAGLTVVGYWLIHTAVARMASDPYRSLVPARRQFLVGCSELAVATALVSGAWGMGIGFWVVGTVAMTTRSVLLFFAPASRNVETPTETEMERMAPEAVE